MNHASLRLPARRRRSPLRGRGRLRRRRRRRATAPSPSPPDSTEGVTLRVGVQKDGIRAVLEQSGALEDAPYEVEFSTFAVRPAAGRGRGRRQDRPGLGRQHAADLRRRRRARTSRSSPTIKERDAAGRTRSCVPKDSDDPASIEDLKGKNDRACAKGSSAHGLLLNALKRVGLRPDDVEDRPSSPPADALAAFSAGRSTRWSVWDPFTIQARQADGARRSPAASPTSTALGFEIASSKALEDPAKRAAIAQGLRRAPAARRGSGRARTRTSGREAWSRGVRACR